MTCRITSSLALSLTAFLLGAVPAFAADNAETARGLSEGAAVPRFNLPVVNGWNGMRKWGPHKWVGHRPKMSKKLVLMSFFATYCEPCKKEMPELVRLYNKYEGEGLGVMLISIDKIKDEDGNLNRDKVVKLATENKVSFPVLHDRFNIVARKYEAVRLPYILMVGADGRVRQSHVGYTEEFKEILENEIRAELGMEPLRTELAKLDGESAPKKHKRQKTKVPAPVFKSILSARSSCASSFRKFHTPMWLGPPSPISHRDICRGQCCCIVDATAQRFNTASPDSENQATQNRLNADACEAGNLASCSEVGLSLKNGRVVAKDLARLAQIFEKACAVDDAHGCNNAGVDFNIGRGVPKDPAMAVRLFERACANDDARGCFNAGVSFANGEGASKNQAKAVRLFEKACAGAHAEACYLAGISYANGRGVSKDQPAAVRLFEKACAGDNVEGCRLLHARSRPLVSSPNTAPSASAANLGGVYKTPLGKVKITEKNDGTVVARTTGKNGCGLKRSRVVFRGMRLDDSVTGTIHACKVGPKCSGKAKGIMMLLITRNGKTLSGAVHFDTGSCKTPLGGDGITITRVDRARTPKKERPKATRPSAMRRSQTKSSKSGDSPRSASTDNKPSPTTAGELERLLQNAAALHASGKTEQARARFREAAELDPESANAFLGLGVTYYVRGRYGEALDEYKNAIAANPSNGDSYYNMACIYALQERKEMAFRYLSIAVLNGYVDESFSTDGDLVSLRDDPRWEQVKNGVPVAANPPE